MHHELDHHPIIGLDQRAVDRRSQILWNRDWEFQDPFVSSFQSRIFHSSSDLSRVRVLLSIGSDFKVLLDAQLNGLDVTRVLIGGIDITDCHLFIRSRKHHVFGSDCSNFEFRAWSVDIEIHRTAHGLSESTQWSANGRDDVSDRGFEFSVGVSLAETARNLWQHELERNGITRRHLSRVRVPLDLQVEVQNLDFLRVRDVFVLAVRWRALSNR